MDIDVFNGSFVFLFFIVKFNVVKDSIKGVVLLLFVEEVKSVFIVGVSIVIV